MRFFRWLDANLQPHEVGTFVLGAVLLIREQNADKAEGVIVAAGIGLCLPALASLAQAKATGRNGNGRNGKGDCRRTGNGPG